MTLEIPHTEKAPTHSYGMEYITIHRRRLNLLTVVLLRTWKAINSEAIPLFYGDKHFSCDSMGRLSSSVCQIGDSTFGPSK